MTAYDRLEIFHEHGIHMMIQRDVHTYAKAMCGISLCIGVSLGGCLQCSQIRYALIAFIVAVITYFRVNELAYSTAVEMYSKWLDSIEKLRTPCIHTQTVFYSYTIGLNEGSNRKRCGHNNGDTFMTFQVFRRDMGSRH